MTNPYQNHVLVLPEDDAIRQIINGFIDHVPLLRQNRVYTLPLAGGWPRVFDELETVYVPSLALYPLRHIVLVIDFDNQAVARLQRARSQIPEEYANRVFVLGITSESEELKKALKLSFEDIGLNLATDCVKNTTKLWGHDLLKENASEVSRLREHVYPILFGGD